MQMQVFAREFPKSTKVFFIESHRLPYNAPADFLTTMGIFCGFRENYLQRKQEMKDSFRLKKKL